MEIIILNENLIQLKLTESIYNIKLRVFNKNVSLEIHYKSENEITSIPINVENTNEEIFIDILEINNTPVIRYLTKDTDVLANIKNVFGNSSIQTSVSEIENVEQIFNNFGNGLSGMLSHSQSQIQIPMQLNKNENNLNWNIKKK